MTAADTKNYCNSPVVHLGSAHRLPNNKAFLKAARFASSAKLLLYMITTSQVSQIRIYLFLDPCNYCLLCMWSNLRLPELLAYTVQAVVSFDLRGKREDFIAVRAFWCGGGKR